MTDLNTVRKEVGIAATVWWDLYHCLLGAVLREKGERAAVQLVRSVMLREQNDRYKEGLAKLGIDENEPPAVKAAKYHFLSNTIGGLKLEFIEESPKKVWIRYRAPTGSFPGTSLVAVPRALREVVYTTWHPRNGELMGCPQLRWTLTKMTCDGHPYDEGYFQEGEDDDTEGNGTARIAMSESPPPHLRNTPPSLAPEQWPEIRLLKAQRNFGADYFIAAADVVLDTYSAKEGLALCELAARVVAVQKQDFFNSQINGGPKTPADRLLMLISTVFKACRIEAEHPKGGEIAVARKQMPPLDKHTETMMGVLFAFSATLGRCIDDRLNLHRKFNGEHEVWSAEFAE